MTSLLESRYRRVLRLLPEGYRRAWEEDMVSTFLASAGGNDHARPSLAEQLSVLALAVRLRLGSTRPLTEVRLRHRVLYCFALMALLFLALVGTAEAAQAVVRSFGYLTGEVRFGSTYAFIASIVFSGVLGPLWTVAFWCFVRGRWAAPRVIMLITLIAIFTALVVPLLTAVFGRAMELIDLVPGALVVAGFVLLTEAVFAAPVDARPPAPRLWLGGYLAGTVVFVAPRVLSMVWPDLRLPSVDPLPTIHVALLLGMVGVLATSAGRRQPEWLFALALFGGGLALFFLSTSAGAESMLLNVVLVLLALACAVMGRVAERAGRPGSAPG